MVIQIVRIINKKLIIMKKILLIITLLITSLIYSQNEIDIVYLKNGSIIKGNIVKIVPNKDVKLTIKNGSIFIVKMSDIDKIEKETNNVVVKNEVLKKRKEKKGEFWKSLGKFATNVLDEAVKNVENNSSNPTNNDINEDPIEDNEIEHNEETTIESVGTICFYNPNFYARKIVLTKRSTTTPETILIGQSSYGKTTSECNYDIPSGIYLCKVYTTFTNKLIEQFSIRVNEGEDTIKNLNKNNYN